YPQVPTPDKQFPVGSGIYDAFLRASENYDGRHPYEVFQTPNKVLSQLTTRSNVFAVYVTVGFFEVRDDTTRPVKLGAEIGRAENRNVRHRMFTIVDRTNLSVATDVRYTARPIVIPPPASANPPQWVTLSGSLSGTFQGAPFDIQRGSTLIVDVGARQEVVVVQDLRSPNSVLVQLQKSHDARAPISLPNVAGAAPF